MDGICDKDQRIQQIRNKFKNTCMTKLKLGYYIKDCKNQELENYSF